MITEKLLMPFVLASQHGPNHLTCIGTILLYFVKFTSLGSFSQISQQSVAVKYVLMILAMHMFAVAVSLMITLTQRESAKLRDPNSVYKFTYLQKTFLLLKFISYFLGVTICQQQVTKFYKNTNLNTFLPY